MKKTLKLSALALLLASTYSYAHHPAADIVDPDIYAMIDENVSDVHRDMTFDDMGGDTADVGSAMESRDTDVGNMGAEMGGDIDNVGAAMAGDMADVGAAMESREEMNSMADSVNAAETSAGTDREPSGPMGAQR